MPLIIIDGQNYTSYYRNMLKYKEFVIQGQIFYINGGILDCSESNITELPELSNRIEELLCNRNELHNLPELPNRLIKLDCSMNELTKLPILPNTLQVLYCSYNILEDLPELPDRLDKIDCTYNNIKHLSPENFKIIKKCVMKSNYCYNITDNPFSVNYKDDIEFINSNS